MRDAGDDAAGQENKPGNQQARRRNRIGVSTYSFWQFNGPKEETPIDYCIEQAAEMGFDGVEILWMQMGSKENSHLFRRKPIMAAGNGTHWILITTGLRKYFAKLGIKDTYPLNLKEKKIPKQPFLKV